MTSNEGTNIEKAGHSIQLIKGEFTPAEASIVITSLLLEKIKFHKMQRLQIWEKNHNCTTADLDSRIIELEKEKEIAREFISLISENGQTLKINGAIEITVV